MSTKKTMDSPTFRDPAICNLRKIGSGNTRLKQSAAIPQGAMIFNLPYLNMRENPSVKRYRGVRAGRDQK